MSNAAAWDGALANINALLAATRTGIVSGVEKITLEFYNDVIQLLSRPGTGRTYRRRGVEHRASAPGEPPAVDTGLYRASWFFKVEPTGDGAYGFAGSPMELGEWLEFGTRGHDGHRGGMEPRPHVRPALAKRLETFQEEIIEAVVSAQQGAVQGVGGTFT